MAKEYPIVDSVESFEAALARVRAAQKVYATYTQEQVDKIFKAAALAANNMRIPLAKMAVEETGMGVVEDKVIKNHYASETIYNAYHNEKTCGIIEEDKAYGIVRIAEPVGVIVVTTSRRSGRKARRRSTSGAAALTSPTDTACSHNGACAASAVSA